MDERRILVAYDGSEAAFRALEQAAEAAQARDGEVDLVVVRGPDIEDAEGLGMEAATYLFEHGFEPAVHVLRGDPATVIRSLAEDEGYEAIYLGTRGHLAHVLEPGASVSAAVVERAPVTTVVAR
ncbi:MAG TPA: universal stress protein [Candidatus Limnocylindrales bacterium]|nr:universal stress protein [Candidatus Limnocylindrales bacterium]